MPQKTPQIVEIDLEQVEELLRRAEEKLDQDDFQLIRSVLQAYAFLVDLVGDKNTTIRRLRKLLFGARTEKTDTVVGGDDASKPDEPFADPFGASDSAEARAGDSASATGGGRRIAGHGRNGAQAYTGAAHVDVPHAELQPGDPCPNCGQGTLYNSRPGVVVRIVGQAPLSATVYHQQKLRCNLCGKVFTAQLPAGVAAKKYDATAAAMIALLKYGSGLPFNRLEGLQRSLGAPLPASTQWDVLCGYCAGPLAAFGELIRQGAQGEVVHNDDTTMKILQLMKENAQRDDEGAGAGRTGMFTSGVVALCGGVKIALFFSGRQHAGENLAEVLKHRAEELEPPIQMCDALSRNASEELATILANCLAHARREFVDIYDSFPDECRRVLEAFKVIYKNDKTARQEGLSAEERLALHQRASQPTMTALKTWLDQQIEEKLVEPNSALGGAITYLRNHWEPLTLFLRKAGAPLDNNICERALKKAILHRKNSYFYKTLRGAKVGDAYMSLIYTCELCGENAFAYLTALHSHAEAVAVDPSSWLPWTYRETMSSLDSAEAGETS